ncbi:helix-turn-helix transcriptional regulator [Nocardia amamiensis]|uniref:Helix-turn-helix transcriptional regulator n=1 Tax=Nocardia amamiensis TaxID=404578 RepID=A0ABS0CX83_9NOCA|nr:helix-turn-helix transcriptional regulator [Nocardia amamiensis]MBF6301207.1 helix-turn-helix transcriptional regulator [Nocardia amamiensis]
MTDLHAERVASSARAEIARANLSQSMVARHLRLSQQAISRRLTGKVTFDVVELKRLADLLGISVEVLIDGGQHKAAS